MRILGVFLCFAMSLIFACPAHATEISAELSPKIADHLAIEADLARILSQAGLKSQAITFQVKTSDVVNSVAVQCDPNNQAVNLQISAKAEEWGATFYYGLQKLGFLFPHPRIQLGPNSETWSQFFREQPLESPCGQTYEWKPRFKFRGFHLHTLHPNEWVSGFFMGETEIANDIVRWHARNGQNALQVVLLANVSDLHDKLKVPFALANDLGISRGVDVSFRSMQQRSFWLGSWLTPNWAIQRNLDYLDKMIDFDFLTVELGTSEFASDAHAATRIWIETARRKLAESHKSLFIKAHVSSHQIDSVTGDNYNFVVKDTDLSIGVLAHTVMYYGLEGPAPVYGRKDFADMKKFLFEEHRKGRPSWYFPETSYYIGMDIDVGGLWLGDYINSRAADMNLIEAEHVPGHLTFTSGQEMGYGIIDWSVALLSNSEYKDNPRIGFKLLGESLDIWSQILDFQTNFIKTPGLLSILSSSNTLDELPYFEQHVIDRNLLTTLKKEPQKTEREKALLEEAVAHMPNEHVVEGIHHQELKLMIELTHLRIHFALALRNALLAEDGSREREQFLVQARQIRQTAALKMEVVQNQCNHYPESIVFKKSVGNPTSYGEGYGWTASSLHFWRREERIVRQPYFCSIEEAFRDQLYQPFRVVQLERIFTLF